jgi:hypothetical protein
MTYYGNEEDEEVEFRLKMQEGGEYATDLVTGFRRDAITGGAYAPWQLVVADVTVDSRDVRSGGLSVYPNPVRERLTVASGVPVLELRLYDISGKMVLASSPEQGRGCSASGPEQGAWCSASGPEQGTSRWICSSLLRGCTPSRW